MPLTLALFSAAVATTSAFAGALVIQTSVPSEVQLDGRPVLKSFTATSTTVSDLSAGPHTVVVYRNGVGRQIEVMLPAEGALRLLVGSESLDTDKAPPPAADAAPPRMELRAAPGQSFALVLDGEREGTLTSARPLAMESLTPGEHMMELRSKDYLTVWVRGTMTLRGGDDLIVSAAEGRMIEVFGREGAWLPLGSEANQVTPTPGG